MAVHDTMVILEGKITVSGDHGSVTAGLGEIIAIQKGDKVTIRSHENGVVVGSNGRNAVQRVRRSNRGEIQCQRLIKKFWRTPTQRSPQATTKNS